MYAHCEYDAGYLVFDRGGTVLEVWRRATDARSSPLPAVKGMSQPDSHMHETADAAFSAADAADPLRGQFVPHALLAVPAGRLAYHLVGTMLVVSSESDAVAFLFDVASGELLEKLDLSSGDDEAWSEIHYVELDPTRRRVFLSTDNGVLVYANEMVHVEGSPDELHTKLVAHIFSESDSRRWMRYAIPDLRLGWVVSDSAPFQALVWKATAGRPPHGASPYIRETLHAGLRSQLTGLQMLPMSLQTAAISL